MKLGLSETSTSLKEGSPGSGSVGEAVHVPRRRGGRGESLRVVRVARQAAVGRQERDREEERRARLAHPLDHRDGALGVVVARVEDRVAVEAVGVEQAVLVERVAVELVGRRVDGRVPLAPARRHLGRVGDPVLVQELADMNGAVAGALEPDREPLALVEPPVAAVRRGVAEHPVVVRILAREERCPRRAAERIRHERAVEGRALGCERIAHAGHHPHRLERLVVGHQHDDVRALRGGGAGGSRREERREQEGRGDALHEQARRMRSSVSRRPSTVSVRTRSRKRPRGRSFLSGMSSTTGGVSPRPTRPAAHEHVCDRDLVALRAADADAEVVAHAARSERPARGAQVEAQSRGGLAGRAGARAERSQPPLEVALDVAVALVAVPAVELERVLDEVVELVLARGLVLDVEEAVVADSAVGRDAVGAPAVLDQDVPAPLLAGVGGEVEQRAAVDQAPGRDPRGVEDRGGHVDVGDQPAVDATARYPRSPHQERDPDRLLVGEHLLGERPVLAVHEAVVGHVDDQGVLELAGAPKRVDDLGHALVHRLQALQLLAPVLLDARHLLGREAAAVRDNLRLVVHRELVEVRPARHRVAGEGVAVARRRGGGAGAGRVVGIARAAAVGRDVPERQVEGPLRGRGILDQAHGAPGGLVGLVVAGPAGLRIGAEHPVLVDLPARVVEGAGVGAAVPVRVARRHPVLELVAVQVAAHVHRAIAGGAQPDRQRAGVVERGEAAEGTAVVEHAVVMGVLAGQVGRPRGAAEREARDRLVEVGAVAPEQRVELRHQRHGRRRLVVGHDHDDVRLRERRGGQAGQDGQRGGDAQEEAGHRHSNTWGTRVLRDA